MELGDQFDGLIKEWKIFSGKAQEEIKTLGTVTTETKEALGKIDQRLNSMQQQVDAIEAKAAKRIGGGSEAKSIGAQFTESPEFLSAKEHDFAGQRPLERAVYMNSSAFPGERKTDITEANLGSATTGVVNLVRMPGVFGLPQQALRIRDVMRVTPQLTGNAFDYVYQATRTNVASPQVEGSAKSQSYFNWASASGAIRTIAHFVNVSKQALADIPWLRGLIDNELTYGLKVKEEAEILSGDNSGVHLNGIITQATSFDTTLLSAPAGYTRLDILRWAKYQARAAGLATYAPSAYVLNPHDMAELDLTKDSYGRYIVGDPKTGVEVTYIWGLPVVESDSITAGTFLVGAFATAAELRDRQQVSIEISYEHDTNFTKNLATVLCEERIGLAVMKAAAFITGSLATTSPAS